MSPNLPTGETMSEGSPMPPRGPMQEAGELDDGEMDSSEVCIPLKALAQPDDQDQVQTPAVGDSVNFSTDGTITRIDGDNAYVKASAVNGVPLDDGSDEVQNPDSQTPDSEGTDLQGIAQQMSQ